MTVPVTAALAGLCFLLAVLFGWRGARTARPHTEPRLVPWRFLMLIAFTGMVAMLVHLVTLIRDPAGAGP
jgi:uncharacterized membrane protein YsdA (DUF1294 family)